jgi:negative regulator of flagellin synthesis FlgM
MSEINNIKSLNQPELATSRNNATRDNQKSTIAENKSVPANRSDTVILTSAAEQIQSLQQVIADVPIVDSERVASLKVAIDNGSYSINSEELAQNLLNFEFQFR